MVPAVQEALVRLESPGQKLGATGVREHLGYPLVLHLQTLTLRKGKKLPKVPQPAGSTWSGPSCRLAQAPPFEAISDCRSF